MTLIKFFTVHGSMKLDQSIEDLASGEIDAEAIVKGVLEMDDELTELHIKLGKLMDRIDELEGIVESLQGGV